MKRRVFLRRGMHARLSNVAPVKEKCGAHPLQPHAVRVKDAAPHRNCPTERLPALVNDMGKVASNLINEGSLRLARWEVALRDEPIGTVRRAFARVSRLPYCGRDAKLAAHNVRPRRGLPNRIHRTNQQTLHVNSTITIGVYGVQSGIEERMRRAGTQAQVDTNLSKTMQPFRVLAPTSPSAMICVR